MKYLSLRLVALFAAALLALAACGDDPEPAANDNDDPNQNQNDDPNQNQNDDPNQNQNDDPNQNQNQNANDCPADTCTVGDTRCAGDEVETCVSVADCPTWSDPTSCDGEQVCSGGECVDECDDVCEDGATECDGDDAVRVCEEQSSGCLDWSPTDDCDAGEVCEDGACQSCDDGDQRCGADGQAVEECYDGQWEPVLSCPVGCENAECVDEVECSPGEYQCNDNIVEVCNSTGTAFLYVATCTADCEDGQCTGDCEPGAQRCNDDDVEVCNDDGTAWELEKSCDDTSCDSTIDDCAKEAWEITSDTEADGTVVVEGPVTVYSGADLYSPAGDLTIIASSITVEDGGSITMAPTGDTPDGEGTAGEMHCNCGWQCTTHAGGTGGSYATAGEGNDCYDAPSSFARDDEIDVVAGSPGGESPDGDPGGAGGGVLKLEAEVIDIAGSLRADGESADEFTGETWCGGQRYNGGGSGGGILVAADDLTFSGTASVEGGEGETFDGCNAPYGGEGGEGVVKFLYGAEYDNTGTVHGVSFEGLMAPLRIFSSTHPDPTLYYNDDFDTIALSWERPFDSVDGYYQALNGYQFFVPYAGNASFTPDEVLTHPRDAVDDGQNYFHVTAVDAQANVGEMESRFPINVNTLPPTVSSSSHSDSTEWSDNRDVFLEWTDERDESNFVGYYYTVDQFGDTVPTAGDTFVPIDQKQTLLADEPDGIWAFHLVPVDTMGYLTKEAETYVYRIGDDPGTGNILGTVRDEDNEGIADATVTINRGLLSEWIPDQPTTDGASYNFGGDVPAGEWELRVSAEGYETKYVDVTLSDGQDNTVDVTLVEE